MNAPLLIVEDDPIQQYIYKELCEQFGYNAHVVRTGEEALSATALTNYSAVVLDIQLPGLSGIETAIQIREREKNGPKRTPMIALTANAEPEDRQACMMADMDDYLSKPFSIDEFRKVLLRWTYDSKRPNLRLITPSQSAEEIFG